VLAMHVDFLLNVWRIVPSGEPDFSVFYTAGKILREGRGANLYDAREQQAVQREFAAVSEHRHGPLPYIHPPFEALIFLPLTFLSFTSAFVLWNVLNLAMLVGVWLLLRESVNRLQVVPLWEGMLALLAFFPIIATFHQGQDAILLLLLVVLGFRALDRDADFAAGCWLGLTVFKYHLVIPLLLLLGLWRGRKLILGSALVSAAAVLVSLGLVGWQGALQYPAYAWHVVSEIRAGGLPPQLIPNLMGLMTGWTFLKDAGWPLELVVWSASIALLITIAAMRGPANDKESFRLSVACAVMVGVLLGYSTNTYDLSLLVLPIALVANYCLGELSGQRAAKMALILPAVPLLVSPLWFFLWLRWQRTNLMAISLLWWLFAVRHEIFRRRDRVGGGADPATVPA
jgi:hypothetical protein